MGFRRLAATALAAAAVLAATATPAAAHTELQGSTPAEGASLAAIPTSVQLTFGEPVTLPADPITVTGPGGATWTIGVTSVAGAVVTAPVQPAGPAGPYVLTYKVTSDDGDTVSGKVNFTLTVPATTQAPPTTTTATTPIATATTTAGPATTPASAQPATQQDDSGVPAWVWILVAVVLVLVIGFVVLRSRRKSPAKSTVD